MLMPTFRKIAPPILYFKTNVLKQRVIVSVSNDLATDQRVSRTCGTLQKMGFDVLLVGRKLPKSLPIARDYQVKRFHLLFRKKAFFYAELNLRLFFYLLFKKADLLLANDIDTALANHAIQKIKRIPLIIDCHEYFCGVPELVGRERTIRIWKHIEKISLAQASHVITVNNAIADLLHQEYRIDVHVVRNVPNRRMIQDDVHLHFDHPFIIYQGAVNVDRGIEEMVEAMQYLPDYQFLIAGKGDILKSLKQHAATLDWKERIHFVGDIPPEQLHAYTRQAVLGVSLEKDTCINYHFCLPNKLFDYIHAGIPVLVSDLPEMKHIVEQYKVGECIHSHDPKALAQKINALLSDNAQLTVYKEHTHKAAEELCWESESHVLEKIVEPYLKK